VLAGGVPACTLDYRKRTWRYLAAHWEESGVVRVFWTATCLEVTIGYSAWPVGQGPAPAGMVFELTADLVESSEPDSIKLEWTFETYAHSIWLPMHSPLRYYAWQPNAELTDGSSDTAYIGAEVHIGRTIKATVGDSMVNYPLVGLNYDAGFGGNAGQFLAAAGYVEGYSPQGPVVVLSRFLAGLTGMWSPRVAGDGTFVSPQTNVGNYFAMTR